MSARERNELVNQCQKMLKITPAAFVFDYGKGTIRCSPASASLGRRATIYTNSAGGPHMNFFLNCSAVRSVIQGSPARSSRVSRLNLAWKSQQRANYRTNDRQHPSSSKVADLQ